MIVIPDFSAGAMENWGLVTYRETALLYDSVETSTTQFQEVAVVVARELSHQVSAKSDITFRANGACVFFSGLEIW